MFADRMTPSRRVALATACGKKKRHGEWPMHLLYKSPRIGAVYNRQEDFPLYILSTEYGLVHCDEVRASYDRRMDSSRAEKLAPLVAEVMRRYGSSSSMPRPRWNTHAASSAVLTSAGCPWRSSVGGPSADSTSVFSWRSSCRAGKRPTAA